MTEDKPATDGRFWMVLSDLNKEEARLPTAERALRRAESLAKANPGREFVVLRSIGAVVMTGIEWTDHDDAPTEPPPRSLRDLISRPEPPGDSHYLDSAAYVVDNDGSEPPYDESETLWEFCEPFKDDYDPHVGIPWSRIVHELKRETPPLRTRATAQRDASVDRNLQPMPQENMNRTVTAVDTNRTNTNSLSRNRETDPPPP